VNKPMTPLDRSILPGTLELLVLRVLRDGSSHGLGVARALRSRSDGVIEMNDGALYQALHRLENDGLVASDWGHAESGKRAKFYTLAERGRSRLDAEVRSWHRYADAVARILGPEFDRSAYPAPEPAP
jgi:transcriptional regulator